jgi:hypothetical protein
VLGHGTVGATVTFSPLRNRSSSFAGEPPVWRIPEPQQEIFAAGFDKMAALQR